MQLHYRIAADNGRYTFQSKAYCISCFNRRFLRACHLAAVIISSIALSSFLPLVRPLQNVSLSTYNLYLESSVLSFRLSVLAIPFALPTVSLMLAICIKDGMSSALQGTLGSLLSRHPFLYPEDAGGCRARE